MKDKKQNLGFIILLMLLILTLIFTLLYINNTYTNNENILNTDESLCKKYAELNHIEIKYVDGDKYVSINNELISENKIKENCLNG